MPARLFVASRVIFETVLNENHKSDNACESRTNFFSDESMWVLTNIARYFEEIWPCGLNIPIVCPWWDT